jgi:hypothetical protein
LRSQYWVPEDFISASNNYTASVACQAVRLSKTYHAELFGLLLLFEERVVDDLLDIVLLALVTLQDLENEILSGGGDVNIVWERDLVGELTLKESVRYAEDRPRT